MMLFVIGSLMLMGCGVGVGIVFCGRVVGRVLVLVPVPEREVVFFGIG